MAGVDDPERADMAVGILFVLLLLEAARRHIGPSLVVLALVFIAYSFAAVAARGSSRTGARRRSA